MRKLSRYILLCLILFFSTSYLLSQQSNKSGEQKNIQLVSDIQKIVDDTFFDKTLIAIDIFDLTDSISLYQKNNELLLRPASNMKLLTSAAAILNLGEYYTFRTDMYHTGVIDGINLYGDLFIVGGFDPGFSLQDLDSLVAVVKSLGIRKISGGVYADISKKDSMYWGKGWMWDDNPEPSAPYLSALNINYNSIEVFVEGNEIDSPAVIKLVPSTSYVEVINNSVAVDKSEVENFLITRDWVNNNNTIIVSGEVSSTQTTGSYEKYSKLNLLYPERYFLALFEERLKQAGILVDKQTDVRNLDKNSVYLTSIYRSIDTVLSVVNKDSDNLSAEMLIYAIAYQDSGAPAIADDGLEAVRRLIDSTGYNPDDYSVADGSGVSHYNLLSAELILEMLKYMYYEQEQLFNLFYNSLSVAGIDGTLKNRMVNTYAQNNVHAKTGTLNGVSNLSGYATSKNGHLLAFSIMIQNFVGEYSEARSIQNKICDLLAEFE